MKRCRLAKLRFLELRLAYEPSNIDYDDEKVCCLSLSIGEQGVGLPATSYRSSSREIQVRSYKLISDAEQTQNSRGR